jgi:hypothetical protein
VTETPFVAQMYFYVAKPQEKSINFSKRDFDVESRMESTKCSPSR